MEQNKKKAGKAALIFQVFKTMPAAYADRSFLFSNDYCLSGIYPAGYSN